MKKGYSESTIKSKTKLLKRLIKLGANLEDPESVKEIIAGIFWITGITLEIWPFFIVIVGILILAGGSI